MLISMALKFGLAWIVSKFPDLFKRFPALLKIIEDLLKSITDGTPKKEAHAIAKERIKKECFGVGCELDLKD